MDDLDCFLEALDNLPDNIIAAKFDGATPPKKHSGKRKKSAFDDTIDLHGMTSDQALTVLEYALKRHCGYGRKLLVITGRGNNSENGVAIIRNSVERFLANNSCCLVREYHQASSRYGGDGAFVVLCK